MAHFPIVDTHVHFWDVNHFEYQWLDEMPPALNRSHVLTDYRDAHGEINIEALVFVQCGAPDGVKEAEWVASMADDDPRIKGIVAEAPLENAEGAKPVLEELTDNQLVKGIRRLIQPESIEFCVQPDFIKGVQMVEAFGFSFDLCIYHPQLANTIELVRQCPNVQFILDHIGKPDIKNHILEPWKSELKTLSEFPNVVCKISGMATEADWENWTRADLRPYIDHVIECFGFDRVMYGSDWPVSTLATEYPRWFDTLKWAVSDCSDDELRKLFHDNAIRFYRLA
jgi:L-fuconolactonase